MFAFEDDSMSRLPASMQQGALRPEVINHLPDNELYQCIDEKKCIEQIGVLTCGKRKGYPQHGADQREDMPVEVVQQR
jgi:hypothetical protein